MTGLLNARAFHERLRDELGRVARYQEPLCCLIMDVDALKHVNDQYGHAAGDAALQSVAAVIRSGLREIDFGARLGASVDIRKPAICRQRKTGNFSGGRDQ